MRSLLLYYIIYKFLLSFHFAFFHLFNPLLYAYEITKEMKIAKEYNLVSVPICFWGMPYISNSFSSTGTIMKEIPWHKCDPKASSVSFQWTVTTRLITQQWRNKGRTHKINKERRDLTTQWPFFLILLFFPSQIYCFGIHKKKYCHHVVRKMEAPFTLLAIPNTIIASINHAHSLAQHTGKVQLLFPLFIYLFFWLIVEFWFTVMVWW